MKTEEADQNMLALVRDEHRFVFLFADKDVERLKQELGNMASDPESPFTWHDATQILNKVKELCPTTE